MLQKQTIPYEILVRLGADGYQAAHVIDLERITDDGVVIVEQQLPAQPISIERAGEILGEASVQLLEQIDGLNAEVASLTQALAQAEQARDAALAQVPVVEAEAAAPVDEPAA